MAASGRRTQDALLVTVRGACPGTCPPLAIAYACHRASRKNLFDLSRCALLHNPNVLPAAAPQRRHALCLTEWSSNYYSPTPGEPAADAGEIRAEPPVGASES
jgi:hypothetical protein